MTGKMLLHVSHFQEMLLWENGICVSQAVMEEKMIPNEINSKAQRKRYEEVSVAGTEQFRRRQVRSEVGE